MTARVVLGAPTSAKRDKQIRSNILESLCELTQIVERQEKRCQTQKRVFVDASIRNQPLAQLLITLQQHPADRRNVKAMVGQKMIGRTADIVGSSFAPVRVKVHLLSRGLQISHPIVQAVQIIRIAVNGSAFYTTDVCRIVSHVFEIFVSRTALEFGVGFERFPQVVFDLFD